jgi:hypothetical protein
MNASFPGCTLSAAQLHARRQELLPGLFEQADTISEIPNGLRLTFSPRPGFLAECARVIEQEQTCCSFLRFQIAIEPQQGLVTLEITGLPGTANMLLALAQKVPADERQL